MSWNVYFANRKLWAMDKMLKDYNVDIANLQETNNRLGAIERESGYVSANTWRRSHDWCGYNFHRGDWNHSWSKEVEVPGNRGVCGALVQRGSSKLCVWGLHPIQNRNNVRFSKESIRKAADEMKRCSSQFGAPSIFMGDFNTKEWWGAKKQLEESTGWDWSLAAKNHIDFIFIQTAPLSVGRVTHSRVVGHGCVPGFPGSNTRTASCGWSDHAAVYAEIELR
jgi:endonuclease/exonuclease/phosphatase family metal-dependent hydrolase